jgi:hypothetical protein
MAKERDKNPNYPILEMTNHSISNNNNTKAYRAVLYWVKN